jgi:PIN domain nuclease of toxin-antitoxin system
MKVLLDTHGLLWAVLNPESLSLTARDIVQNQNNTILVSAASAWEIATKVRLGKLPKAIEFEMRFIEIVVEVAQYTLLPISTEVSLRAGRLVAAHKDPFDRMIAAQALDLDIDVISIDTKLDAFGVRRIW